VKLVESLQGEGMLHVRGRPPSPANYAISYWRLTGGAGLIGLGHMSAEIATIQAAECCERAWLALEDGRRVDIKFRRRGAGSDWGEIDAGEPVGPLPGGNVVPLLRQKKRRSYR